MQLEYRGYRMCLEDDDEEFSAVLVEVATGALLPTKIVGSADESSRDLAVRARKLIDLYVKGEERQLAAPAS